MVNLQVQYVPPPPPNQTVVVEGGFDAGARFGVGATPNIPVSLMCASLLSKQYFRAIQLKSTHYHQYRSVLIYGNKTMFCSQIK